MDIEASFPGGDMAWRKFLEHNLRGDSQEEYVFYTGTDNLITIKADKVKPGDLEVTISQGIIIPNGNGNYIVRVNKPGRVILQLFNKKHKNIGAASFEVKPKDKSAATPSTLKG